MFAHLFEVRRIHASGISRALLTGLVLILAGCVADVTLYSAPEKPPMRGARVDAAETAELVVVVRSQFTDKERNWVVYVDDVPRAFLPSHECFTRIPIRPGRHDVTLGYRQWIGLGVTVPLPIPMFSSRPSEEKVKLVLVCESGRVCGLTARAFIQSGPYGTIRSRPELVVDAELIEEDKIEFETFKAATFVAPDK